MPAEKPLEWNMEELVKLRLQHDLFFDDYTFKHHDERGAAGLEVISLRAVKGEVNLDGVQGYNVDVFVTFQTTTLSVTQAESLSLKISELLYKNDPTFVPDLPDLAFVSLEPGTDTTRVDTKKLRKRVVKFPFIGKLIS